MRHKAAAVTMAAAAALDATGGVAFAAAEHIPVTSGLFWAVTTATTVGYGDITPHTAAGHAIAVLVMLTVIPLFAATFSLFTSGLAAGHVRAAEQRLKQHLEERLDEHRKAISEAGRRTPPRRHQDPGATGERKATREDSTMTLRMADSITAANLPPGYDAYASYTDGRWPAFAAVKARFPAARVLSITVTSADPAADACDCETGDLTPAQAIAWAQVRIQAGEWRPVIYAGSSTMAADVLPHLTMARPSVRLWSAHYGAGEHICGPATCRLVPVPMDGTQWTDTAAGENGTQVDASVLADDFFSPAPAAAAAPAIREDLMPQLRAGKDTADCFSPGVPFTAVHLASDPSGDGLPQTAIRVALHHSGADWLVDTVTLTPARPTATLTVAAGAYDAVKTTRLDDGGAAGISFT